AEPLPSTVEDLTKRPEANNLVSIYAAMNDSTVADVLQEKAGAQFSTFKKDLADLTIAKLVPITNRMRELMGDPTEIDSILNKGAEKANALTQKNLLDIKNRVGLWTT
ncbi:MAG: tryptophan--tRNA ligase, partial [Alphaproteobacteria bacterium]|nr:tryptophan--tRNA ligase [Alphaproteobacteria bacterium]